MTLQSPHDFTLWKLALTLIAVTFSSYRAVNALRLCYKNNQLMLYSEIIAVCSQIHTKHVNTLWAERTAQ
jgi:hypothetical protein